MSLASCNINVRMLRLFFYKFFIEIAIGTFTMRENIIAKFFKSTFRKSNSQYIVTILQ